MRQNTAVFAAPFRLGVLLSLLVVAVISVAHSQTSYSIMDLGPLTGGESQGFGINTSGQITGDFNRPFTPEHAFRTTATGPITASSDLGTLSLGLPDSGRSIGYCINIDGQVAGNLYYLVDNNTSATRAFRTTAMGTITAASNLGVLGGSYSSGRGINASGQVTGYSTVDGNSTITHAFRTTSTGTIIASSDLGTLGGTNSSGFGINDTGQVTGNSSITNNFTTHAFRTTSTGTITASSDLGTLGFASSVSYGYGINAAGQVTGYSETKIGQGHAFRTTATGTLSDGTATDLGVILGYSTSQGNALNDSGQVVGFIGSGLNPDRAFLYTTSMVDLNTLLAPADQSNWLLQDALGINNAGQITGWGLYYGIDPINPQTHAFRLTPNAVTPEPAPIALLASLCLAGVGFLVRSKYACA